MFCRFKNIVYFCVLNLIFKACKTIKILTELLFGFNHPLHALLIGNEGSFRFLPSYIGLGNVGYSSITVYHNNHKELSVNSRSGLNIPTRTATNIISIIMDSVQGRIWLLCVWKFKVKYSLILNFIVLAYLELQGKMFYAIIIN